MTARHLTVLTKYVQSLANQLGLMDWVISVLPEPCDPCCFATIHCIEGTKKGRIRFCHNVHELPPEKVRYVVVHELLHCHTAGMSQVVEFDVPKVSVVAPDMQAVLYSIHTREEERCVDGLAFAIASFFPLPPSLT